MGALKCPDHAAKTNRTLTRGAPTEELPRPRWSLTCMKGVEIASLPGVFCGLSPNCLREKTQLCVYGRLDCGEVKSAFPTRFAVPKHALREGDLDDALTPPRRMTDEPNCYPDPTHLR